ncbi:MAG: hypothetical protein KBA46_06195 [Candidatus Omnitrophica bacterium]|nr:hypothetical protein [Candidatus Omnitrophota bacterium]
MAKEVFLVWWMRFTARYGKRMQNAPLKVFGIMCGIVLAGGCALVQHYDEIMVLKHYGDNQREIEMLLTQQTNQFYKLREAIQGNALRKGTSKAQILAAYGEPIVCRKSKEGQEPGEVCLYRHPTEYFSSDKIFLAFDEQARLRSWELILECGKASTQR